MKRSELIWYVRQLPWLAGVTLICLAVYAFLGLLAICLLTGFGLLLL